jgi:agmatine deiminase
MSYRMPAEWEHHQATWLAWPHNTSTWPTDIDCVEHTFLIILKYLARHEDVYVLVQSHRQSERIRSLLEAHDVNADRVFFKCIPTRGVWIRDYGPNFLNVTDGTPRYNLWQFNAWGKKYDDLIDDAEVGIAIHEHLQGDCFMQEMVLEGGSIDVNGQGLCLSTRSCLLNPNRNPQLDADAIESHVKDALGAQTLLWLQGGLLGDDTDGHVDDVARFVNPQTVVLAWDKANGPNESVLKENFALLQEQSQRLPHPLSLVKLPLPDPVAHEGKVLPASYANFYIANQVVLVPTFDDAQDEVALDVLRSYFPGREVVGIDCRVMVRGFGAIHCATQQQPG